MLKTLKLASYLAVLLAVCGVGAIVVLGMKENTEVKEYLDQPSLTDRLRDEYAGQKNSEDKDAPLVTQAQALALRFDPPPPPKPKPAAKPAAKPAVTRNVPKPPLPKPKPKPKVQKTVQFNLLATVVYDSMPEKSLALLQTSGNQQEWFRQGEKLGYHEINEVRDGSVVFTQGGQKPQEIFVPAKPQVKSILKNDTSANASPRRGAGSITVQEVQPDQPEPTATATRPATVNVPVAGSSRVPVIRPTPSAQPERSIPARTVRTVEPQTPEEQKESIESSISGIQEIMSTVESQDMSEAEKQEQQESFKLLLEMLNTENKRLEEEARKAAVGREKPAESATSEAQDNGSEESTKNDAEASN